MKSARDVVMDYFEGCEEMAKIAKRKQVLIVGGQLFDDLVAQGYDVTGIHRYEAYPLTMAVPQIQTHSTGPRTRWGELR
jgi:hypothetical protein